MALSENRDLARSLGIASHPLRLDLLEAFVGGIVASPTEAALALGETRPNVLHHIRALQDAGFLAAMRGSLGSGPGRYEATARARALVDALSSLT
jgi:DNA-binding transcriptional ArsR family regulator